MCIQWIGGYLLRRKNRGYQNFLMRTSGINYRETPKIIEQFNISVSLYKRFVSVLKAGDDDLCRVGFKKLS